MIRAESHLFVALATLVLGSVGCAQPPDDTEASQDTVSEATTGNLADMAAVRSGVDATNRAAEQAVAEGDVAGFVQRVYTDDAVILPPGAPKMTGHEAIEQFWSSAAEQLGLTGIRLQTDELVPMGPDMAYELGTGTLETGQGEMQAKYVVIWRRSEDGSWRWHVDIWNELPATGSAGP